MARLLAVASDVSGSLYMVQPRWSSGVANGCELTHATQVFVGLVMLKECQCIMKKLVNDERFAL